MYLVACGAESSPDSDVTLLEAGQRHYGKTYAEWAAEWMRYINAFSPPKCADPLTDETGAACGVDQDPKSPVFFLVGAFGGNIRRECRIPVGKALFFPLMNTWGDNAGVAEDMLLPNAELAKYVERAVKGFDPEFLWLRVDGVDVENLAQGKVVRAPYEIDLPVDDNPYTCRKIGGVGGRFKGYTGGYWALLAPLEPGMHVVEFGFRRTQDTVTGDPIELTVSYSLEIE